jgi:purine-binding chemotaxis protein CheW
VTVAVYVDVAAGPERFAFPVDAVREVGGLGQLERVPGTRPPLLGIRHLRGRILPVFDFGLLIGATAGGRDETGRHVVVIEHDGVTAGLAVDGITGVRELPGPSEATLSPILAGAVLADDALVGIVDVERLLADLHERA